MRIYLDHNATTPVAPEVADAMATALRTTFGNPSSLHRHGQEAKTALDEARTAVARLLGAAPTEIVFTSGGSESDNLAIRGAAVALAGGKRRHLVASAIEHEAVLQTLKALSKQGWTTTLVRVDASGVVAAEQLEEAITDQTALVSVMHANNETGVINDIAAIGALCRDNGVLFHTDAAQSVGKLDLNVQALQVDLLSVCAHKIYGPKGIGALYVRRAPDVKVAAQIHGGGHERGMRSGTLATHQIVGMGEAVALAARLRDEEGPRIAGLRDRLWQGISQLDGVSLNGEGAPRLPGHLNVAFADVDGEMLLTAMNQAAVSSGSACTSASLEPSYVLKAMGVPDALAHGSIRFSVGRFTSEADIDRVIDNVTQVIPRLRKVAG